MAFQPAATHAGGIKMKRNIPALWIVGLDSTQKGCLNNKGREEAGWSEDPTEFCGVGLITQTKIDFTKVFEGLFHVIFNFPHQFLFCHANGLPCDPKPVGNGLKGNGLIGGEPFL